MQSLSKGKYMGKVAKKLNVGGNIFSTTYYFENNENCDWHYHENPHISFIFEGEDYSESIYSSSNKSFENGVTFYHAGEKHRWVKQGPFSKSANIELGSGFYNKNNLSESQLNAAITRSIDTKFLMLKIQQEILLNDQTSSTCIQTLLFELVSQSNKTFGNATPKWVSRLDEILDDRWNENLSLKELSIETGVHPITISKHFRKYFSCTLGEYLRKLKVNKSISLIKNSDLTLTDIAFQCGFSDQSHFTRTFKSYVGFLPKNFRNI